MGKSSSAKKVARLAQRGKGKKVRFQGGTVFPLVIVLVIVAGLALIVYGRSTVPGFDSEAAAESQARVAFGFYLCDEWVVLEDATADDPFVEFGVAPSPDQPGVATVQALPADGNRGARLGNLMDAYGVELSDSRLRVPDGDAFDRNTTNCNGSNASLSVVTWEGPEDATTGVVSIAGLRDVRLARNPMVVAIAFTSSGTTVLQPPSAEALLPQPAGPALDFGDGIDVEIDPDAEVDPDADTDPDAVTDPDPATDDPEADESGEG